MCMRNTQNYVNTHNFNKEYTQLLFNVSYLEQIKIHIKYGNGNGTKSAGGSFSLTWVIYIKGDYLTYWL